MLLLAALFSFAALGDIGVHDPEFARYPLKQWLREGRQSQIKWSVMAGPAELSTHQRMIFRMTIRVDGRELEKRRSAGEFVGLIEYSDKAGNVWQNHLAIDTTRLQGAMQRQYLDISFYAFVLPGDYAVTLAVCDPKTLEHSISSRKLHVEALKPDPLPGSWAGLPPIETVPGSRETPDVWFLPDVQTRLNLPVESKRPLHIQLVLNATPTGKSAGSMVAMRENMSLLIPAMKILSGMQLKTGTVDVSLLDLTRHRVPFGQTETVLDWDLLRRYFFESTPGIIDIHALESQRKMLGFFRDEVTERMAPRKDGALPVVIVLSGPAFFEDQEDVPSAKAIDLARLFYIRYRTISALRRNVPGRLPPGRYGAGFPVRSLALADSSQLIPPMREDDLQRTAEPLNARLFDAASPLQFRRILALIIDQLSRM